MSIYSQFECVIEELGTKNKHIFKDNVMFVVWKFWCNW